MPEWENVVQGMIDQFGSDARTVGVLLGFLKCLVEESGNPRIAISVRTLAFILFPILVTRYRGFNLEDYRKELMNRVNRLGRI